MPKLSLQRQVGQKDSARASFAKIQNFSKLPPCLIKTGRTTAQTDKQRQKQKRVQGHSPPTTTLTKSKNFLSSSDVCLGLFIRAPQGHEERTETRRYKPLLISLTLWTCSPLPTLPLSLIFTSLHLPLPSSHCPFMFRSCSASLSCFCFVSLHRTRCAALFNALFSDSQNYSRICCL